MAGCVCVITAQGPSGHWLVGGEKMHCASLFFSWGLFLSLFAIFLFITIFYYYSSILNCSYLNQFYFFFSSFSSPSHCGGASNEEAAV